MTADGSDRHGGAPRFDGPRYDAVRIDAPQFDVVLRGYDRRQVDEHLVRLARVVSRMRKDLEAAHGAPPVAPPPARPRPAPRPRPDGPPGRNTPDVVGSFTDRMQTILQAAEEEATEIKAKAQAGAQAAVRAEEERLARLRAEAEKARVTVANLIRQRDTVLADLTRMRGQLEAMLSAPTMRIPVPNQDALGKDTAAAARRDVGAGHPLPGTPAPPESDATGAGTRKDDKPATSDAPDETAGPPAAGHDPGAAERTTVTAAAGTSPGERTVAVAQSGTSPGERTVAVAPSGARTTGPGRGDAAVDRNAPPADAAPADVPADDDAPAGAAPANPAAAPVDETVSIGAVGRPASGAPAPKSGAAPAAQKPQDGDPELPRPDRASASTSR